MTAAATSITNIDDGGANTPAEVRAALESILGSPYGQLPAHTTAYEWDGTTVADGTIVTTSGAQTLHERDSMLTADITTVQTTADINGVFFAETISVGDAWAVPLVNVVCPNDVNVDYGIAFTDGVVDASKGVTSGLEDRQAVLTSWSRMHGTITNIVSGANLKVAIGGNLSRALWFRLLYVSANTFRASVSLDGESWTELGQSDLSYTMTPTHVGVFWMTNGTAYGAPFLARFGPLVKLT